LHWRTPGQARWVPLLDTKLLSRLASGRKTETYWPVALADGKFHCIILKGGDQYPYFPRPLLSDFDLEMPILSHKTEEDEEVLGTAILGTEEAKLEERFVRQSVEAAQMTDLLESTHSSHSQRTELARKEVEIDKILLQLLAAECREGEERGMKALEIVELMRDRTGRMIEAAVKVAGRFGRGLLEEKIRDIGERRLAGMEED
jgi:chromosome transmission fidelity protein 4